MAENIVSVELLLTIIAALSSLQIIIFGFFIRKHIREFDDVKSTLNQLKTEHCMIQKDKTGMQ